MVSKFEFNALYPVPKVNWIYAPHVFHLMFSSTIYDTPLLMIYRLKHFILMSTT